MYLLDVQSFLCFHLFFSDFAPHTYARTHARTSARAHTRARSLRHTQCQFSSRVRLERDHLIERDLPWVIKYLLRSCVLFFCNFFFLLQQIQGSSLAISLRRNRVPFSFHDHFSRCARNAILSKIADITHGRLCQKFREKMCEGEYRV